MRKRFSTIIVLFILLPALAIGQTASPSPDMMQTFETVDMHNGIVAFIAPETHSQLVSGNSVAIIGDDGVLVVDTGHFPALTRKMIAEIRKRTDKPVRIVVNTHWHDDHTSGNSVYRDLFPEVSIVSTPNTKTLADLYNPKFLQLEREKLPVIIEQLTQLLASGKTKEGKPLEAASRESYESLLADLKEFRPIVDEIRYESPNVTFDQRMDVFLGKRHVQVMFLGRGNTGGDAVVYVPDAKVLVTGDLVVGPVPFATESYIEGWINIMDKLRAFDAGTIVPGHGPVEHDLAYVETVQQTLKSIVSQVKQAISEGKSLDETVKFVNLDKEKSAAVGANPIRAKNWDKYFSEPAIKSAYKQLKGIPTDENPFDNGN